MFRFLKECLETWIKCLIGEILVFLILGFLTLVASGVIMLVVAAVQYLGR